MAQREFPINWMGQYTAYNNAYYGGGSPIRVGGSENFQSFVGFPSSARDAIATSKTPARMIFMFYVSDGAEFDFGAHKETYDKGYGTMPWYEYIGLHPVYGVGWQSIDITDYFKNRYMNQGFHGIVLYGVANSGGFGSALGATGDGNSAKIIIEGTWNSPPNTPVVTYPQGGEIVDGGFTMTWNSGGDPDGDALTYQATIWNGVDWINQPQVNSTSFYFDTSGMAESASAKVAVRAFDPSGEYSVWSYSNSFTINHNKAPAKPTQLSPSGGVIVDRTANIRLSWKHNDDGAQASYRVAWRIKGNTTWSYLPSSTGYYVTTNQYHDLAPNFFTVVNDIEWQVLTRDQQNLDSPYSDIAQFKASNASNAPTITKPTAGQVLNTSSLEITWSSSNQSQYEVLLRNSADTATLWSSSGANNTKSVFPNYTLANSTTYIIKVRIIDSTTGLWSSYAQVTFSTSFSPPVKPTITGAQASTEGTLNVTYLSNTGTPATDYVRFMRREYTPTGINPWVFISDRLTIDGTFTDYTLASDVPYEYKAIGYNIVNNTSNESDVFTYTYTFNATIVQEASNLTNIQVLSIVNSRDVDFEIDSQEMVFAGREKPVTEFGENERTEVELEWEVNSYAEVKMFRDMLRRRDTLLYRDGNGRREWVTAGKLSVSDKPVSGFVLKTTFTAVAFDEEQIIL